MGDAETGQHGAPDMFGIVGAEGAAAFQGDLLALDREIPADRVALMDVADPLVALQIVQRSRRAAPG
nr:hypothetical protein [Rhizobium sp. G21]